MSSYEARLEEFTHGRTFIRLRQPIRNRADGSCDACGSAQPRLLHGLKDENTGRYFFVGDQCVRALIERRIVRRASSRESSEAAYDRELEQRRTNFDHSGNDPQQVETEDREAAEPPPPAAAGGPPGLLVFIAVLHPEASTQLLQRVDSVPKGLLIPPSGEGQDLVDRLSESLLSLLEDAGMLQHVVPLGDPHKSDAGEATVMRWATGADRLAGDHR